MEERNETFEEMKQRWEAECMESEKKHRTGIYNPTFMFIVRVFLFPACLLIRLFRWTYHYED